MATLDQDDLDAITGIVGAVLTALGTPAGADFAADIKKIDNTLLYASQSQEHMQVGGWTGYGSSFDHTPEAGSTIPTDIDEFTFSAASMVPEGISDFVPFEQWDNNAEDFIELEDNLPLSQYAMLYVYINNTNGLNTIPRINFEMLTHPSPGQSDFPGMRRQFQTPRVLAGEVASLWVMANGRCQPYKNSEGPEIMLRDEQLRIQESIGMAAADMDSQLAAILAAGGGSGITPEQYAALAKEATLLAVRAAAGFQRAPAVTGSTITVVRGDTAKITFPILSSDWDLTTPAGNIAHLTVKYRGSDTTKLLDVSATITGARTIEYTPAATDFPSAGRFDYDVEVTAADGSSPRTAHIGRLIVLQDVRQ